MKHKYEIRPRKDHRGVDLVSDALSLGAAHIARARETEVPNLTKRPRKLIAAKVVYRSDSSIHN